MTAPILYIEDDDLNVELMRRIVAYRHRQLVFAQNGAEGIAAAVEVSPCLILLDLHLPDMSGADALAAIKTDPRSSSIPVFVVTGDVVSDEPRRMLANGAVGVILKPIAIDEVFAAIDGLAS